MNENPLVGTIRAIIDDALTEPLSDIHGGWQEQSTPTILTHLADALAERVAAHFEPAGMIGHGLTARPVFVVVPTTGETT